MNCSRDVNFVKIEGRIKKDSRIAQTTVVGRIIIKNKCLT